MDKSKTGTQNEPMVDDDAAVDSIDASALHSRSAHVSMRPSQQLQTTYSAAPYDASAHAPVLYVGALICVLPVAQAVTLAHCRSSESEGATLSYVPASHFLLTLLQMRFSSGVGSRDWYWPGPHTVTAWQNVFDVNVGACTW